MHQAYLSDCEPSLETLPRSSETNRLIQCAISQLLPFIRKADAETECHKFGKTSDELSIPTALVHPLSLSRKALASALETSLSFTDHGLGLDGFEKMLSQILKYSVNPNAPGFMDKLTASPLPPGVAADLILSVLNTNLHVYRVSPVLTLIEKCVVKKLANMFGFPGPRRGGINVQGGSASNLTSIVVARNSLYPQTKDSGNGAVKGKLLIFTSAHGHYSTQKAAQVLGFGTDGVISVPVDTTGHIIPSELERLVVQAKSEGNVPFYVSATAGTTVLGSFDPFEDIARIAHEHNMWFHVDAAWGGGFIFSENPVNRSQLKGTDKADSIAINPHKMLGVPMTCSFLLGNDMRQFHQANTLKARYLFHDDLDDEETRNETECNGTFPAEAKDVVETCSNTNDVLPSEDEWQEPDDLADMTLQCGRRGDSLKFFLSWQYYGTKGYAEKVDHAHEMACYLASIVSEHHQLTPVLTRHSKPSCLQVCFYFTPDGKFVRGLRSQEGYLESIETGYMKRSSSIQDAKALGLLNSQVTAAIAKDLTRKGFMIDFAPPLTGDEDRGNFFRAVVNISTVKETVDELVKALVEVGEDWVQTKASEIRQMSRDNSREV